jgi:hypothetical protein
MWSLDTNIEIHFQLKNIPTFPQVLPFSSDSDNDIDSHYYRSGGS